MNCIAMSSTRRRVLALYKELHRLGRDYPDPKYPYPFISIHLKLITAALHTAMTLTVASDGCSTVRPITYYKQLIFSSEALSLIVIDREP